MIGGRNGGASSRTRGVAPASAVVLALAALAGCGGSPGSSGPSSSATSAPATSTPSSTTTTLPSVAVSDATGATFLVATGPVMSAPYIDVGSFLWSAAPGQQFFRDTLTMTNSSRATENLSDVDDLTSGLAPDVQFVMSSADASKSGFSADCGIAPGYPSSLCPISVGQGVMVDADSANHKDRSVVLLTPGASAQVTLSYGPILSSVSPASVGMYFSSGQSMPVDLTP